MEAVFTPESFVACAAVTEVYEAPAVAAVAAKLEEVGKRRGAPLDEQERKYCGALVCALMEANGYKKTNRKARVGRTPFSRGEVYERPKGVPSPFA